MFNTSNHKCHSAPATAQQTYLTSATAQRTCPALVISTEAKRSGEIFKAGAQHG